MLPAPGQPDDSLDLPQLVTAKVPKDILQNIREHPSYKVQLKELQLALSQRATEPLKALRSYSVKNLS